MIAPGQRGPERLALRQRDTLLALEAYVDRLAAQVANLQSLLRRSRRRADEAVGETEGAAAAAPSAGTAGGVAHALADRRRALGLSQRAAARAASYSRSEVSELERGTRRNREALRRYTATLERLEHEARWRRTGIVDPARVAPSLSSTAGGVLVSLSALIDGACPWRRGDLVRDDAPHPRDLEPPEGLVWLADGSPGHQHPPAGDVDGRDWGGLFWVWADLLR